VIDWLKLRVPVRVPDRIAGNTLMVLTPDGEVVRQRMLSMPVRGSHEQNIHVWSCAVTGQLIIDGNPAKFFQGHNVFGSADIHGLSYALIGRVLSALGYVPSHDEQSLIESGMVEVSRVDVTESYSTGSPVRASAAVRVLAEGCTFKHRGRGLMSEGTCYFGKHSRRSALKAYSKGDELRAHKLPDDLVARGEVLDFAADLLRIEVVMRRMELIDRGLSYLACWEDSTGDTLHREMLAKLNIPENVELPPDRLKGLPGRLQLAYAAWLRGDDLRVTLPRRTFYRYRAELLKHGIDLLALRAADAKSNVLPLVQIIRCVPVAVPAWARGTPLYFEPALRRAS
jgi:II/X family phage/plasmid replication protein